MITLHNFKKMPGCKGKNAIHEKEDKKRKERSQYYERKKKHLIADASFPSGMYRKGDTLKFGSSLCLKAEPSSSITYLEKTQKKKTKVRKITQK